jgi:hypothetical protein
MHPAIERFVKEHRTNKTARPVGNYTIRFGKHRGKTYDWIYDNDKEYVAWVVTNKDETYIERIKKYFMERIEEEAEAMDAGEIET